MRFRLASCFWLSSLFGLLTACGIGGSEAGNPAMVRGVQGQIAQTTPAALIQSAVIDNCSSDAILAVDSQGREMTAALQTDCSFRIELPVDTAYHILVVAGDVTVAAMQFQNDEQLFPAPVMIVAEDSDDIDLGAIHISDGVALPEQEPSLQNDLDGDGISDFYDRDDDNDGIADVDEADCDLDGIIDDFDEDADECQDVSSLQLAKIKEVFPRNGTGLTADTEAVPTDTIIMVRLNCHILEELLTPETFRVRAFGDEVDCDYVFTSGVNELECRPRQGMLPAMVYTATIDGLRCNDRRWVETKSWSWRTRDP